MKIEDIRLGMELLVPLMVVGVTYDDKDDPIVHVAPNKNKRWSNLTTLDAKVIEKAIPVVPVKGQDEDNQSFIEKAYLASEGYI